MLDRKSLYSSRWFALADLGCAAAGGVSCWLLPQLGSWPLALAVLPWLARLLGRRFPFRRTSLDIPVALFLLTALVGAWASYDRPAATAKLWVLLGAVFFFYAMAGQPRSNFWLVCAFLSASAASISIYFLLTNDWRVTHPDLDLINRLAFPWMALRPKLPAPAPQPNIAGGLIALLLPFIIALLLDAWRKGRVWRVLYALATGGMAALGLLMSSSRAAWLALGLALGGWLLWGLCGFLARGDLRRRVLIFASLATLLLCAAVALALRTPGGPKAWVDRLPGPNSAVSRLEIDRNSLRLVRDFSFTGGGLHSFAGLFSRYIRGEPNFIFNYGHNLYMDVALEQGLPGLAAFLAILAVTTWLLFTGKRGHELRPVILAALAVMVLHGLVDDPLYASRGTPFLFLVPGLAVLATRRAEEPASAASKGSWRRYVILAGIAGALLAAAVLATAFRRPLLSAWYADLGAVEMARVELVDFPTGQFDDGRRTAELAPAVALFQKSLALDPDNVTANYRLRLVAMMRRDFALAQTYLEKAFTADPGQRGAQKSLGYCYVWLGQLERAKQTLQGIPEAGREMEAYVSWWQVQGRPDLATRAEEMAGQLP